MPEGPPRLGNFARFLRPALWWQYHSVNPQQVTCAAPLNLR